MLNIGIAELRLIYAISQMQPCTVQLINMMYEGNSPITSASRQVSLCIQKGLIQKRKAPPVPKLSDDDKLEIELTGRDPFGRGRRPWLFSLTPAGERVAAGIEIIIEETSNERRDSTGRTVQESRRVNGTAQRDTRMDGQH